ncbi:TPA: autotransporter outer membrane beta-barrel domain-containing protein [Campylobacter jejuni]|nr:autotransporter outer membrane beta-barrel domain-containing protein [Campylobacter jejuni]EJY0262904.1 autotransporter outer membrane beta-barrel domain-containing protein [Campylobacter jejuni]ELS1197767.1 autotransporter outer membrane beta-barrel domain-containing protein [Campylobacter jejuni]HDV8173182.1 autotransporter outer membrane beta-barrel domain-containing protein [Campylobacter jejuni]HEF7395195.1 autotransporter outer membrane beta-barrel domain-containing protein [Campylobac
MKLSFSASKVLVGFGLGAALCSNAMAVDLNSKNTLVKAQTTPTEIELGGISGKNLQDYFEVKGQDVVLINGDSLKGNDLTIKSNIPRFDDESFLNPDDKDIDTDEFKYVFDLGDKNTLNIENDGMESSYIANLYVNAKEIILKDMNLYVNQSGSVFNGDLSLSGTNLVEDDTQKGSRVSVYGNNLVVNGNLNADKTFFEFGNPYAVQNYSIKVANNANITNSKFSVNGTSFRDLFAKNTLLIQAQGFNKDISTSNTAGASYGKFASDYIHIDKNQDTFQSITLDKNLLNMELVDYNLKEVNCGSSKCLVANGTATEHLKNTLTQLKIDLKMLEKLIKQFNDNEHIKKQLEDQKNKLNEIIQKGENNPNLDKEVVKLYNLKEGSAEYNAVLNLREIADKLVDQGLGLDLKSFSGVKLALQIKKDTDNTGKSVSNFNSASSAVNTTMNISNDVSIGSRVAMLNNPFGTYASKMNGLKFAALDSDMRPSYVNEYTNSVWANAFGGANIIDGDSGAMYGATVGVDKQANDDVLWGAYFTYANAKIKDNNLEQKSDNFQLGMYSTINIAPQWELNLKAYAQVSPTKQDNVQVDGAYNSDYTSKFLGLSANAGRVFDLSDNTLFIKPFAGVNYYFSYTPSHTENGAIAKDIDSMKNNSVSVEVGAEFRKYMNENSYIFVTPKIEQFVINSGDDYTANLAVNNAFFTSVEANNKKKTYGQIIVGGNVDFTNQLSMNLGFGAKQILAGKVDNKNETYLSGQVGLKYKF